MNDLIKYKVKTLINNGILCKFIKNKCIDKTIDPTCTQFKS